MPYKWPLKNQWRQFFVVLTKKEKICFLVCLSLFLFSAFFLSVYYYQKNTKLVPVSGGSFTEGIVGSPRWINPVFAPSNDPDQDITELIFSGLMKYDQSGHLVPDLAKTYKVLEEGKVYEFYLKDNLFWQDSHPLTADDIIFTVKTIQNPNINSPLRPRWTGVEVEKISDYALRFKLKNESSVFLENCTLKIIPKHIWQSITPENFSLSSFNLNPVGSGPYKLKKIYQSKDGKIISLDLVRNNLYFDRLPFIPKISFKFFESQKQLIKAWKSNEIDALSLNSINDIPFCLASGEIIKNCQQSNLYSFLLPRYFGLFFNLKNSDLLNQSVRKALNYGTNKSEILKSVFLNYGKVVDSPVLPDIYNFKEPSVVYHFDTKKANEILEKDGFVRTENGGLREKIVEKSPSFQFKSDLYLGSRGNEVTELQKCLSRLSSEKNQIYPEGEITGYFGKKTKAAVVNFQEKYKNDILVPAGLTQGNGRVKTLTRKKLNEVCFEKKTEHFPLQFSLVTVNQPLMIKTAEILKDQYKSLGVEVNIKTFDIAVLETEILRKRKFDMLLFGEMLGITPDPFPFWHSLQRTEFGLNLSNYNNPKSDKLLEEARKSLDENVRKEKLEKFQDIIIDDAPAVFLYNPDYLYLVSKDIKGIKNGLIPEPAMRFSGIENWYIKSKRVWK